MRITIKTNGPIKDRDIKALYTLWHAVHEQRSKRMKIANLQFIADKLGYELVPKK